MKRLMQLLFALMCFTLPISAQQDTIPTPTVRYVVILWFADDSTHLFKTTDSLKLTRVMKDITGTVYAFTGKPALLDVLHAITRPGDENKTPIVQYAEYDITHRRQVVPDTPSDATATWGHEMIRAPEVWATGNRGESITVGIMDTGVTPNPAQITVVGGYSPVLNSSEPADLLDNVPGCNGHGTHVAGTVASKDYGVAPDAKIYVYKVFEVINGNCSAWASNQMGAISHAITNNTTRVINISIGGSYNGSYAMWVENFAKAGGIFVAAAGNSASTMSGQGSYPMGIGVGALESGGNRASYSGQGTAIDVMAPGSNITSLSTSGGTTGKSGTSMAAPHVAGAVALLLHRNPNLKAADIHHLLAMTAKDMGVAGRDNSHGHGKIDIFAADSILISNPSFKAPPATFQAATFTKSKASVGAATSTVDTLLVNSLTDHWKVEPLSPTIPGITASTMTATVKGVSLSVNWSVVAVPKTFTLNLVRP